MKNLIFILFFSLFVFSCQPIEKNDQIVFDNNQFTYLKILSTTIEIEDLFDKKISDPYIGHTLKTSPSQRVINWVNDNFTAIGNENLFYIKILDATLTKKEFENKDAKNFDEKYNYIYELFYLIEFSLYDDSNNLLATTLVEASRSTTSGIYISIQEKENIINDLIYYCFVDLSIESNQLLRQYMLDYLL